MSNNYNVMLRANNLTEAKNQKLRKEINDHKLYLNKLQVEIDDLHNLNEQQIRYLYNKLKKEEAKFNNMNETLVKQKQRDKRKRQRNKNEK